MDLSLSEKYRALQSEARTFIRAHADQAPKAGGGRKRPDRKALEWQKLLVEHGYAAAPFRANTAASAPSPMSWKQ